MTALRADIEGFNKKYYAFKKEMDMLDLVKVVIGVFWFKSKKFKKNYLTFKRSVENNSLSNIW